MKWLSDEALEQLRVSADLPDLSETRYRLLGKLGHGGMGSVYRVQDTVLDRQVALKLIGFPDARGELAARLLREAQIIARLEHPGIVPVHDVGTLPDGRVFYTMKLVQGLRLDRHIAAVESQRERLRIFQKICEAVAFAHANGVLHRDLKPENVMVGPFGEVLVMDWGLSKVLRDGDHPKSAAAQTQSRSRQPEEGDSLLTAKETADGAVMGTPGYMSPEQARGDLALLDQRADVFALGSILRILLTCSASSRPASEVAGDAAEHGLPRALVAVVRKATSDAASERYASAQDLALDVAHYLDGLPVSAYPEGPLGRLWRWAVRNRAGLLLVAAYLVMRALLIFLRPK